MAEAQLEGEWELAGHAHWSVETQVPTDTENR